MSFSYETVLENGMLIDANEVYPMFEVIRDYVNNCIHKDGGSNGIMNADLVFEYLNPAVVFKSTESPVHNMRIVADAYESAGALIIQSDIDDDGTYENDILALPNDISDFLSLYPPVKAHSDVTIDKVDPKFNFNYDTDTIFQLMVDGSADAFFLKHSVDDGANWITPVTINKSNSTVKIGTSTSPYALTVSGDLDVGGTYLNSITEGDLDITTYIITVTITFQVGETILIYDTGEFIANTGTDPILFVRRTDSNSMRILSIRRKATDDEITMVVYNGSGSSGVKSFSVFVVELAVS